MKHKIQSHLKNRLLTPIKDQQRILEGKKRTERIKSKKMAFPVAVISTEQQMKEIQNELESKSGGSEDAYDSDLQQE